MKFYFRNARPRKKKIALENKYKIAVPLFGAANAAPNKGTTILYWFKSPSTVLNPTVNSKIQGLLVIIQYFSRQIEFSRTLQDSPVYSSTFQACGNPVHPNML